MQDPSNRRRHPRIKTRLLGRYMLADGREARCTVIDVSLSGIALRAAERGAVGEQVIVYVDQLGRLQGTIARHLDEGFAVALTVTTRATEKFALRLADLETNAALVPEPERRQEPRVPIESGQAAANGGPRPYEVIDLSLTGADVKMSGPKPKIGTLITLGKLQGRVVRHSANGIGIEFVDAKQSTLTDRIAVVSLRR